MTGFRRRREQREQAEIVIAKGAFLRLGAECDLIVGIQVHHALIFDTGGAAEKFEVQVRRRIAGRVEELPLARSCNEGDTIVKLSAEEIRVESKVSRLQIVGIAGSRIDRQKIRRRP